MVNKKAKIVNQGLGQLLRALRPWLSLKKKKAKIAADLPLVSSSASDLPLELLTSILCRLPRKSLKRFECVSKSWCSLIQSPYFLTLHSQQYKYNTNLDLLVLHHSRLWLLGLNKTSTDVVDHSLNLSDYYNNNILRYCSRSEEIYGPRNGMYCLYNPDNMKITLMNSSLKEFKVVPVPQQSIFQLPPGDEEVRETAVEFGFDPKTNDYKVVLFRTSWFTGGIWTAAELFSLNTNSWRKLNDVPWVEISPRPSSSISAPYVNENVHWLAEVKNIIVAFDMVSEVFRMYQLPKIGNSVVRTLAVYNGYLAVLADTDSKFRFDIWIMRNYGKDESWTKHCTIVITIPELGYIHSNDVLGFWQNDEQVVLMGKRFFCQRPEIFLYDLFTQNFEKIYDADYLKCTLHVAYLDALPGAKSQAGIM